MVKFGKNKFKSLNKIVKKQKSVADASSNKILKKKLNVEKKVSFQKEVLLKEVATGDSNLVKNVSAKEILVNELSKILSSKTTKKKSDTVKKPKEKPVEKHKKRQQTQISDTKLLLSLMKKK